LLQLLYIVLLHCAYIYKRFVYVIHVTKMFLFIFVLIKQFTVNLIHMSDLLLASLPIYRPAHFNELGPALCNYRIFPGQDVHVKLNPGLSWQKLHSAEKVSFLPANWT